jgi:hypothetical protein
MTVMRLTMVAGDDGALAEPSTAVGNASPLVISQVRMAVGLATTARSQWTANGPWEQH